MNFEILFDVSFDSICSDILSPIENKTVLSLYNDFEDGKWRYKQFQKFIWDNVKETALSEQERKALIGQDQTILAAAAQNLRLTDKKKDISQGSEISEILLYGIMKNFYKALPVVPKIFYKQNPQDNAKGADSVHIVINDDETDFSLWFGEAKFYKSIENARITEIIKSIGNSLDSRKIRKENSIITNVGDIDDLIDNIQLRNTIKELLDNRNTIDNIKPKLHIPILLLHECTITKNAQELSSEYLQQLREYHEERANAFFKKQIDKLSGSVHKYDQIFFHIIFFPIPQKKPIVDHFVKNAKFYKESY